MKYIFTLLLILKTVENNYLNKISDSEKTEIYEYFSNFLQKFCDFNIIFHGTNQNIFHVNNVVKRINLITLKNPSYSTVLIYNHDLTKQEFIRPQVSKIVNVIFDFDLILWKYLGTYKIIHASDVVIFISNYDMREILKENGEYFSRFAGNVLLIYNKDKKGINVFKTCYYCGKNSKKFFNLEITNDTDTKIKSEQLFPDNFR